MTTVGKLFDRIKNNPYDVSFQDIRKVLSEHGFSLDRISGSHHIFRTGGLIFVVPVRGRKVKAVYVRRVIELIEQQEQEHDESA